MSASRSLAPLSTRRFLSSILIAAACSTGCSGETAKPGVVNNPPVAAVAAALQTSAKGQEVVLDGSASADPDGDSLTYLWTQTAGPSVELSDSTSAQARFVAPHLSGTLVFTLTVKDGALTSAPATTVVAIHNVAPVPNAGAAQSVAKRANVILDGLASTDADGDTLTYAWEQVSGPAVTLTGATTGSPSFVAPGEAGELDFVLVTSDGESESAPAFVTVTVLNNPPSAVISPPATKVAGETVTMNASGSSDPDSDMLSYSWVQTSGEIVDLQVSGGTATFVVPDIDADLGFEVTVDDGDAVATATTMIRALSIDGELARFDRNPFRPQLDELFKEILGVATEDQRAYVLTSASITVVDLTDPDHMRVLGAVGLDGVQIRLGFVPPSFFAVQSGRAFLAKGSTLRMYDVADPTRMSLLGTYKSEAVGNAACLAVSGTRAFVGSDGGGIAVIDIVDARAPALVETYEPTVKFTTIAASGPRLYAAENVGMTVDIIDTSGASLSSRGSYAAGAAIGAIAAAGTRLFVTVGTEVRAVDCTNPSGAMDVRTYSESTSSTLLGIQAVGERAYILASQPSRLVVIAAPLGTTPTLVGAYDLAGASKFAVGAAIVVVDNARVWQLPVGVPPPPLPRGYYYAPSPIESIATVPDATTTDATLYVGTTDGKIEILDVQNRENPVHVKTVTPPGTTAAVAGITACRTTGGKTWVYAARGATGVNVLDATDPGNPLAPAGSCNPVGTANAREVALHTNGCGLSFSVADDSALRYVSSNATATICTVSATKYTPPALPPPPSGSPILTAAVGVENSDLVVDSSANDSLRLINNAAEQASLRIEGLSDVVFGTATTTAFALGDATVSKIDNQTSYLGVSAERELEPVPSGSQLAFEGGYVFVPEVGGIRVLTSSLAVRAFYGKHFYGTGATKLVVGPKVDVGNGVLAGPVFVAESGSRVVQVMRRLELPTATLISGTGGLVREYEVKWRDYDEPEGGGTYVDQDEQVRCVTTRGTCRVVSIDQSSHSARVSWTRPDNRAGSLYVAVGNYDYYEIAAVLLLALP